MLSALVNSCALLLLSSLCTFFLAQRMLPKQQNLLDNYISRFFFFLMFCKFITAVLFFFFFCGQLGIMSTSYISLFATVCCYNRQSAKISMTGLFFFSTKWAIFRPLASCVECCISSPSQHIDCLHTINYFPSNKV